MSDDTRKTDEELDKVSGGAATHPGPVDPVRPGGPPTHPGHPAPDPIGKRPTHPGE